MSRIVLIEDDEGIAEMLHFNLELAGHQVLTAHDGATGLDLAGIGAPDVVLLDLDLRPPGMDGVEVRRRLRASCAARVIVLTSSEEPEVDAWPGLKPDAGDVISKPFSMRHLLARIASVLEQDDLSAPDLAADTRA